MKGLGIAFGVVVFSGVINLAFSLYAGDFSLLPMVNIVCAIIQTLCGAIGLLVYFKGKKQEEQKTTD